MNVLIIGGTGFIGSFVVRSLAAQGHHVMVFHRGQTNSSLPDEVAHIEGSRAELMAHVQQFRKLQPDVVLDMITRTQRDGQQFVEVFRRISHRLVVVSSADVYRARDRFVRDDPGIPDGTPLTEDSPLRQRLFPYSDVRHEPGSDAFSTTYEKILVENAVMNSPDIAATIVRLPMVYGPGDKQHRCFEYLKRMDDGRPFILLPDDIAGWRAPRGYVEDMAEAIALCVTSDQAANRIYHAADQGNVTEAEWVKRIAKAAGWQGEVISLPNEQLPPHLQHNYDASQDWSLDSSRIRQELSYVEPTPYDEAMQRTMEWERANPPSEIDLAKFDYVAEDTAVNTVHDLRL